MSFFSFLLLGLGWVGWLVDSTERHKVPPHPLLPSASAALILFRLSSSSPTHAAALSRDAVASTPTLMPLARPAVHILSPRKRREEERERGFFVVVCAAWDVLLSWNNADYRNINAKLLLLFSSALMQQQQ